MPLISRYISLNSSAVTMRFPQALAAVSFLEVLLYRDRSQCTSMSVLFLLTLSSNEATDSMMLFHEASVFLLLSQDDVAIGQTLFA